MSHIEYVTELLYVFIISFGFVMVFVSLIYSTFAYIKERDFDEVIKFSCYHFGVAFIAKYYLGIEKQRFSICFICFVCPSEFFYSIFLS
jgi:hypothetical protein